MRSKRLFAMLLALCMVFSLVSPAALAVEVAPQNAIAQKTNSNNQTSAPNKLQLTEEQLKEVALNTLRDLQIDQKEVELTETHTNKGAWEIAPGQKPSASLLPSEAPACLNELKLAAETIDANELVSAFVVMEEKPLAETHNSIRQVSAETKKLVLDKQDAMIAAIERVVLSGQKLDVRYQFAYLTNAFTITTEFKNLEKIAGMAGVKTVFLVPTYDAVPTDAESAQPNTSASGAMTGVHQVWEDLGYTGQGMKIAIVDTGLDLDHPSFAAAPVTTADSLTVADVASVLHLLNAYGKYRGLTAEDLYRSEKVPFAFNYVDRSLTADHSRDQQGDHGTHVAGIAAANKLEGTSVVGMAPDAQIIVMKVFGAAGGAYADDYVAAIEDAMTLGCDVVNLSLGSPAGFSSSDTELDLIFERIASQDTIVTMSAGNEGTSSYGNMWGTDLNRAENPENGTIGSPSLYANGFSIASAENCVVMTNYFELADGTKIFYMDSYEYLLGQTYMNMQLLADQELEYVVIDGLGAVADFYAEDGSSLVEGKVAVILRGELSFSEKCFNAQNAGAVAAIIWNNQVEDVFSFGMNTTNQEDGSIPGIPVCLIPVESGELMAAAETKTMTVSPELGQREAEGGQMSSFSSWGTTSDLRLVPDITGIGGNVFSCYDNGQYGLMSGTSMSSPQIAGVSALVMQYLKELYPNAMDGQIREMAEYLMMSTAKPIISNASGVEASPRQQGSGLIDAAAAVKAEAYLTVGGGRPKAELGDNTSGVFTFSFEIHNITGEEQVYNLKGSVLGEALTSDGVNIYMAEQDWALEGTASFNRDTVTVPANGRANVTVTVAMSDYDKALYEYYFPNGSYVEGFIYLDNVNDDAQDLSLPYMGFYGDWTQAPVFDSAFWWEPTAWNYPTADGMPDGDQYWTMFWTNLGGSDWLLGMNPYSGAVYHDKEGAILYNPANNAVSPNGDGLIDGIEEIYLSLLRNAKYLNFTYTVDGEVVHVENITNASKTMYRSNYGQIVPWLYSWYGNGMYDFTDAQGKPLPSGTEVLLTVNAAVDYKHGGEHSLEIPMVVDTEKPELIKVEQIAEGDTYWLIVEASDETLAAVMLLNANGTRIMDAAYNYEFGRGENGGKIAQFNITGMGTEFTLALGDFAANESYYNITYTAAPDGNLPEMDTSKLYGYRVNDSIIWEVNGYDYQFGWVSMNLPENDPYGAGYIWVEAETEDYMEYYAINAAEYAGGKIFAVDAGGNFLVMDPGLWNRQVITNLGKNVVDMAFDDTTDTMYLVESDPDYGYIFLHSVDLLTGETTQLKSYYYGVAPWAITVDENGTIYAIARDDSGLYTLDKDNRYALVPVTDANGSAIVLTDMYGDEIAPYYAQSMTYSDGKIYFGYFLSNYMGSYSELIVIDTADFSYAGYPFVAVYPELGGAYMNDTGLVGMLFLDETEYTIPESEELLYITMSEDRLIMNLGHEERLSVVATPWNYEMGEVTFTSSDESVATVTADGTVKAVGAGDAIITASYGDFTTECLVTVVDVKGNYYGYAYYSGDGYSGYFIDVDLATLDYGLVGPSMADFIAGDYNGHDGLFYGYTEGGQLYSMNFADGNVTPIGSACGVTFMDMAYDYTTGLMYGISVDYMTGMTTLYAIDLKTGRLFEQGTTYDACMTLAIDAQGQMFSITADGYLVQLGMMEDWMTGELMFGTVNYWMEGLGTLQYLQSMCYDYANDVFIWANPETSTVYWVDLNDGMSYVLPLGNPTGTSMFEHVGMFTIPAEIPALPEVPVADVIVEDMFMLVDQVSYPNASILPLNANGYTLEMTSSDETVVSVVDGMLVANAAGEAVITLVINDAYAAEPITKEIHVTVAPGADNLFGFLMADILTYESGYWMNIDPTNPKAPELLNYMDYTIYAQEHVDGKIIAVGYDNYDYSAAWQMLILDAETFEVLDTITLKDGYPFVYDMTYDYTTSTMYCVAGPSDSASDLYIMDLETGDLTMVMSTAPFLMALAAGPEGTLYAVAMSEMKASEDDFWDPWAPVEYDGAVLYAIDPVAGTMEIVGNTGIVHAALTSMTYDYDTGYLYWTPLDMNSMSGGLAITDPATAESYILGAIGNAGAQVTGLYVLADEYPEAKTDLMAVKLNPEKACLTAGETLAIKAVTIAAGLDAEFVWTSSNENVATVDGEGNVTAVAPGTATITVTVTSNGVTKTAECAIGVLAADAVFLTYNVTDNAWATISRADMTVVENVAGNGDFAPVNTIAAIDDVVYGVDDDNNLFSLTTDTFERAELAALDTNAAIVEYLISMGYDEETAAEEAALYGFWTRDLAYDAANERMLLLGNIYDADWGKEWYMDYSFCIYEVDLTDGSLTMLWQNWNDESNIAAITVGPDGTVYYYSAFDDYYTALDLATGEAADIVSLYRLGYYGSAEHVHSLYYDEVSGLIYHLFTSNGTFSRMFTVDPASGEVALASEYVGDAYYNEDTWQYVADVFQGLEFVEVPYELRIINQPKNVEVAVGAAFEITVDAYGEGLTYEWYYKNAGNSSFKLTTSFTGNTYATTMSTVRDGRQVYCVITDAYGNQVVTDTVTMSIKKNYAEIVEQPEDVLAANGEEFTISLVARGDGLTYQWYYKNAGSSTFKLTKTFTGNTYTTTMSDVRDGRQVYCVVTDKYGTSVQSEIVTMTMDQPIKIIAQPEDVVAANGEEFTITVEAEGEGLTYKWYYKNSGSSTFKLTKTFTGNTYTTTMSDVRDGRQVYCVITDQYGNTLKTDVVTMTMDKSLKITAQPEDVVAANGEEFTITVEAQGEGLTYKWYYKNAGSSTFKLTTTFSGNTYTTTMSAVRDGRQVYCVITDASGNSVKTDVVTMTMG